MLRVCCFSPLGPHTSEDSLSDSEALATSFQVQYMPRQHRRALSSTSLHTGRYEHQPSQVSELLQQYSSQWDECVWDVNQVPAHDESTSQVLPRGTGLWSAQARKDCPTGPPETAPPLQLRQPKSERCDSRFQFPARSISAHVPGRFDQSAARTELTHAQDNLACQRKSEGSRETFGKDKHLDLRNTEGIPGRRSEGHKRGTSCHMDVDTWQPWAGPTQETGFLSSRHLYLDLRGAGREHVRDSHPPQNNSSDPPHLTFKEMAMRRVMSNPRLLSPVKGTCGEQNTKQGLTFKQQALLSHNTKVRQEVSRTASQGRARRGKPKEASPLSAWWREEEPSERHQAEVSHQALQMLRREEEEASCGLLSQKDEARRLVESWLSDHSKPRVVRSISQGRCRYTGEGEGDSLQSVGEGSANQSRPRSQESWRQGDAEPEVLSFREMAKRSHRAKLKSLRVPLEGAQGGAKNSTKSREFARSADHSPVLGEKGSKHQWHNATWHKAREAPPARSEEVALSLEADGEEIFESGEFGRMRGEKKWSSVENERNCAPQRDQEPAGAQEMQSVLKNQNQVGRSVLSSADSLYVSPRVLRENYLRRVSESLPHRGNALRGGNEGGYKGDDRRSNSGGKVSAMKAEEKNEGVPGFGASEGLNVRFAESVEVRQLKWVSAQSSRHAEL